MVVEGKREKKEVSRTVIESAVIEKLPGAMGDALAVVQNFAGVARAQAASGQIMIRGSSPNDTAYFVEGSLIPTINHFGGLRSVIPTGMMESLQFYPGNFSPYYSWVTGGVIDLDLKKLKPKRIGGYIDVNLLDGGFFLEIYRALATYRYVPSSRFENTFRLSQGRDISNIQFANFVIDQTLDRFNTTRPTS